MIVQKYQSDKTSREYKGEEYGIRYVEVGTEYIPKTTKLIYRRVIRIVDQPTGNCQMTIAGAFYQLIENYDHKQIVDLLPKLKDFFSTRCLLVDIPRYCTTKYLKALEELGYTVVFHTPYENTTGSSMDVIYANYHPEWDDDDYDDGNWEDEDDDEF